MIKKLKTIAIIPARSGSKGLPGKNVKILLGKPLISWSIESALSSKNIDLVIVSTDSQEIADLSIKFGAEVPFLRPKNLSDDYASSFSVVEHAIKYYKNEKNINFDLVALLEPTSPIRENDDIDNMIDKLFSNYDNKDAIISLGEVSEYPFLMKTLDKDFSINKYINLESKSFRRQDQKKLYFPFGVAYISKVSTLLIEKTFYPKRSLGYILKKYQNYEVDDIYDFICIESLLRYRKKNKDD